MITRIKSDRIIVNDALQAGYVYFDEAGIIDVTAAELAYDTEYDAQDKIVSPGFIDIHVHGGGGREFCEETPEGIAEAANYHLEHGTTTIVPTCSTLTFSQMQEFLGNLKICMDQKLSKANIAGAHLEGPYLALSQCGAQDPNLITPPKQEEYTALIKEYGEYIKRWSYAPERDENDAFCKYLVKNGIIAAIAHSDAKYQDCVSAFAAGCRLVTHLYSCTSTVTRDHGYRSGGIIEAAYLLDDMDVEIIADGKHLPPELIQLIYKIKGKNRITLITDALKAAGADITASDSYGVGYIVEDGVCKLPDRSAFAGSIATTDRLIRTCIQDAGISLVSAVKMMCENPARILGIDAGVLEQGKRADLVVFDDDIMVSAVFVGGKQQKG